MAGALVLVAVILGVGVGSARCSAPIESAKASMAAKASPDLLALYQAYGDAQRRGESFRADNPLWRIVGDRVVIDAVASGDVEVLKADLVALGMRSPSAFGRIVSGELPIAAIPALDTVESLAFAQAAAASTGPRPGPAPRGP